MADTDREPVADLVAQLRGKLDPKRGSTVPSYIQCDRAADIIEAAADVLNDIGPCDIRGRWCLQHHTNECSVGKLAALLAPAGRTE